ncbi:hypothetical protein D3C80_1940250 [compost metagenome]
MHVGHGLAGIDDQVDDDLLQLDPVAFYVRARCAQLQVWANLMVADVMLHERQ